MDRTPNRAVAINLNMRYGSKTSLFLLANGEATWHLLPRDASLLFDSTVQPENLFLCPQGDSLSLRNPKKDMLQH